MSRASISSSRTVQASIGSIARPARSSCVLRDRPVRTSSSNTSSPSRFLVPRNHLSFIPPIRTGESESNVRRRKLVDTFTSARDAIRVCKNCETSGKPEKYKISSSSDCYVEYTRCSYSCNLAPFSPVQ